VNAIDNRYTPFAVSPPNAVPWASKEAAAAAAAHRVFRTFYRPDSLFIDSVYAVWLAPLPNDSTKARGIAVGDTVARRYLELRSGDGREAVVPYVWQPAGPGVYQPTPPGAAQYTPATPWYALLRPFALTSVAQFRPPNPPALDGNAYALDFNEIKRFGSRDSSQTTAAQRDLARFHTEAPHIQMCRNIRQLSQQRGLSLVENARFFAQILVTLNDATITAWDVKFAQNRWRPVTAIRSADIDGNILTERDTTWNSLVSAPPHQEYPAAHGSLWGSFAYSVERFFGTANVTGVLTSTAAASRPFSTVNQIVADATDARVYGGVNFRISSEAAAAIAQNVAQWVAQNHFLPRSTPVAGNGTVVREFRLQQNYPNPFNPSTTIRFTMPERGYGRLTVSDVTGRTIATLLDGHLEAGEHSVEFSRPDLASGVYFYRLTAGAFTATRRMLLVR
jgi:hypothetical protein